MSYTCLSPTYKAYISKTSSVYIPNHVQDALIDPKWKSAMIEEMKVLHKNHTWELVKLPLEKKDGGVQVGVYSET